MNYLLDTNVCIMYLNNSHPEITAKLKNLKPNDVCLCQIVKAELVFGAYKSERQPENLALLEKFFAQFASLPFNDKAVEAYGQIRAELARGGQQIGPNDLIIADTAVAHDVTLVTNNTNEFSRIPQLKLDDWVQKK